MSDIKISTAISTPGGKTHLSEIVRRSTVHWRPVSGTAKILPRWVDTINPAVINRHLHSSAYSSKQRSF